MRCGLTSFSAVLFSLSLLCAHAADPAPVRRETFTAGDKWRAIDWTPMRIVKGSALDFSESLSAPAGLSGDVLVKDGNFVFKDASGKPVRFYGTSVTHELPFLEKERCDQLVDYLAASGYNLVRLHNYNFPKGISLIKEPGSTEFDPLRLDQFDYLLYALKQKGIYYTFPLNPWGAFKPGDAADVEEFATRGFRFEAGGLLPISNQLKDWFKKYSANLLHHVNPYTGLKIKDDPALVSLEITNENALFAVMQHHSEFVGIFRRLYREELRQKLQREPTDEEVEKGLPAFVVRLQEDFYQWAKTYLKSIGLEKPLTDANHRSEYAYVGPRSKMDYVDIHGYWDLYKTAPGVKISDPGDPPYRVKAKNPNTQNWAPVPAQLAAARIFGLPFASGEFSSNYPTPYWCYTGPGEAVLAGLQGWSSIIRYAQMPFPARAFQASPIVRVESGGSPLVMFSERIAALLYRENEIQPLATKIPLILTPEFIASTLDLKGGTSAPTGYIKMAFDYQLGTILLDGTGAPDGTESLKGTESTNGTENLDAYPCLVAPPGMTIPDRLKKHKIFTATSDVGEKVKAYLSTRPASPPSPWTVDPQTGYARILTPRSETFLMPEGLDHAEGHHVSLTGNDGISVCFAGSIDGAPLPESKRLLVLYLTDVKNTGTEIAHDDEGGMTVEKYGKLPLLIRQGRVNFSVKIPGRPLPEIWALKYDGTRAVRITPQEIEGGFTFEAQSVTAPDTFAAYELVWGEQGAGR